MLFQCNVFNSKIKQPFPWFLIAQIFFRLCVHNLNIFLEREVFKSKRSLWLFKTRNHLYKDFHKSSRLAGKCRTIRIHPYNVFS